MALQQKHYFSTILIIFFASLFFSSYNASEFDVGGNNGWVLNPSESYNHWAGRMRFRVNDTLLFRYGKGRDSVLEVSKDDYEKCNTENPIKKMDDGYSVFQLDRSGPFYFISGIQENCENGQKIAVVVLAVRNHNAPPPPSTPSPPPHHSPTGSPPEGSPTAPPKGCRNTPAMAVPPAEAPALIPAPAGTPEPPSPTPSSPAPSDAPSSATPVSSPEKSPPVGDGCNDDSSIRSDPANVHIPPAGSPPTSAAPAAIHLSAISVSTFILVICFASGEFIISS